MNRNEQQTAAGESGGLHRGRIEIQTARLCLVPLGSQYLESTAAYAMVPENTRYMMWCAETTAEVAEFLSDAEREWTEESPLYYEFAVLLDGHHIGAVSVHLEKDHSGELGWIFHRAYWGKGYATEAAQAVRDFALHTLGLTHLIAHCDTENIGSWRVMEKLGMVRTAVHGDRKNWSSDEERQEYQYELFV